MTKVTVCNTENEWDDAVLQLGGHPLQLWGWGEVKAAHKWRVERVFIYEDKVIIGAAQLLFRPLPGPLKSLVYIPRGPVVEHADKKAVVLEALATYVKEAHKAVAITIEPDWEKMPSVKGWQRSDNTILIPRTLILDLSKSEDELQAHMTKKTRQYIRKSTKEGITVKRVTSQIDLTTCLEIYKQTAQRAGFSLHDDQYYRDIFEMMGEHSPLFAAFIGGKPVAFLWLAISQETAFELYGGVNEEGQSSRANYVLKWHAISTMKKWGIHRYDFNGLLNDGVSAFKQGFSDHETLLAGTYDKPLSPLYAVWSKGLPLAKGVIRKIKNR